jgi:riboflavin kinase/FMN adenylyltransferase
MATRLGCPTANVAVQVGATIPGLGVYVGETEIDGKRFASLICVNDGRTGNNLKLEVHLLDANEDLRNKFLKVTLCEKMRSLVPFQGEEKMRDIIAGDIDRARDWFAGHQVV